ncbi:Serine protease inhibitor [Congregibacter litoralis KT71]|uniref:Serine protease inhibitor n=2 Tax=Congregibacter TaxID=393661 RepID=A4ABN4_9GAMM|nr:Serine protease inhibitor [Congregibacter litoralis KT71]
MRLRLFIFGLVMHCACSGLVSAQSGDISAESLRPQELQDATSINAIASDLLLARLEYGSQSNAMISSVSLYYALALLSEGAGTTTRDLLNRRLLQNSDTELSEVAPALAKAISSPFLEGVSQGAFSLSSSLWAHSGNDSPPACQQRTDAFEFKDTFLKQAASLYNAGDRSLDFVSPESPGVINSWVEEQTRGLVQKVINQKTLECLDWAIINAATFEGAWAISARRLPIYDGYRFVNVEGNLQPAETFRSNDHIAPVADFADGSSAFELPFSGGKYSFIVHMPSSDTDDVWSWLLQDSIPGAQEVIAAVLSNTGALNELTIQMPVFAFNDAVEMTATSQLPKAMGIEGLFSQSADFGRMSELPSYVRLIKQDTRLELDEKGVKAAAVTVVLGKVGVTSVRRSYPRREIIVDRPFSFAIVERSTGTMLFNGVVTSIDSAD